MDLDEDFTTLNESGYFDERWESDEIPDDLARLVSNHDEWDQWDEE